MADLVGVLPVDKPRGPTSHDVVAIARRALRERRIGHTGTLDPFATGLLLLCIGRATRLAEYLTTLPKRYTATARLGATTPTLDETSEVSATSEEWRSLSAAEMERAFTSQVGERMQLPPAFSAKRQGGERLYEKARRGDIVRAAPSRVRIHRLSVTRVEPPEVDFEVECSSGTYIRAIARDAGEELGVGAHLTSLRRDAIGEFRVEDSLGLEELERPDRVAGALVSPLAALSHLERVDLSHEGADAMRHGRALPAPEGVGEGVVAAAFEGRLVAVAFSLGGELRPRKVFGV